MSNYLLLVAYISLLHAGPIINLLGFLPGGRVFPVTTVGHLIVVYLALSHFTARNKEIAGLSKLDLAVGAFGVWSLASVVLFFQSGNPSDVEAYWYGIHLSVLPMFGYFAVKNLTANEQVKLLRFALLFNVFLLAWGMYLWWARPDFYTVHLREMVFNGTEGWADWQIYARLQGYLGSTAVGVICALSVVMAGALELSALKTLVVVSVALPAVMLTNQRGGIGATVFALAYLLLARRKHRGLHLALTVGGGAVAAALLIFVTSRSEGGLSYYLNRREEFGNVMEGRSGYTVGVHYVTEFPFGVGLGGSGNAAAASGLSGWGKVVDANYMRIWADLGVEGLLLFLLVLAFGLHAALRRRRNVGMASLIFIYAMIAVGTNVFDGHLTPHLFWIFLGIADTPETVVAEQTATDEATGPAEEFTAASPEAA